MIFTETEVEGLFLIEGKNFKDIRGEFVKTFNKDLFEQKGLTPEFVETYYSISKKNVIRGMHFQRPPHDHIKLIYVPSGKILDVVLDIRKFSPTYGKYYSVELSSNNSNMLYVPSGCAHGFLSLEDLTNVTYMQSSMYAPENDSGIYFDSFGFQWGKDIKFILSDRDNSFCDFNEFNTPFLGSKTL